MPDMALDKKMWRTSLEEMNRRWSLVRDHLRDKNLDVLIVQGYEDKIGGGVKWLTDVPAGYPVTVLFFPDDLMTVIEQGGPHGQRRSLGGQNPDRPGVDLVISNWAFHLASYTSHLAADDVVAELKRRGCKRVGIAGEQGLPYSFVSGIRESLSDVAFYDETEFLDHAKARKSAEEIEQVEATARIQDEVFEKLLNWIEPGKRDFEINAFIDYELQLLKAERGVYIAVSAQIGTPATFGYRHFQGGTMEQGDLSSVLLESNGPGGQWAELGRVVSFGKVPSEVRDACEICKEAQAGTAERCKPGTPAADVFAWYNDFMKENGSEPERRLHAHGQGYDTVERPLIRADETMTLDVGLNVAIHPFYLKQPVYAFLCDNYLVDLDGVGRFLHKAEKKIFEL